MFFSARYFQLCGHLFGQGFESFLERSFGRTENARPYLPDTRIPVGDSGIEQWCGPVVHAFSHIDSRRRPREIHGGESEGWIIPQGGRPPVRGEVFQAWCAGLFGLPDLTGLAAFRG